MWPSGCTTDVAVSGTIRWPTKNTKTRSFRIETYPIYIYIYLGSCQNSGTNGIPWRLIIGFPSQKWIYGLFKHCEAGFRDAPRYIKLYLRNIQKDWRYMERHTNTVEYVGVIQHPATVTTRIIRVFIGDPYKASLAIAGREHPKG